MNVPCRGWSLAGILGLGLLGSLAACGDDTPTGGTGPSGGAGPTAASGEPSSNANGARGSDPAALDFLAELAARGAQAEAAGLACVEGRGSDLVFVRELRHMGVQGFWGDAAQTASRAERADRRDPMPAILDFNAQMDALGIEWAFVPVPAKVAVDPGVVGAEVDAPEERFDVFHQAFYNLLRAEGVPVLDLTDEFRELVAKGERAHCATDSHWTGAAVAVAARAIRVRCGNPAWLTAAAKSTFGEEAREVSFQGDLRRMSPEDGPDETASVRVVRGADGALVQPDAESPILLLGDSHTLIWHAGDDMHATGAGLPDHLAREFGMPVDLIGVRGSGATPARIDARRSGRVATKKFVVWCMTVREFTESAQGWAEVPLTKDGARKPAVDGVPEGYDLVYQQDFSDPVAAAKDFVVSDPDVWQVTAEGGLEHTERANYDPPHRSPHNIALLRTLQVDDFVLEAEVQQTGREYGHRDLCVFFGFRGPADYAYAHVATSADANAHHIQRVKDGPRTPITTDRTAGVAWGVDVWRTLRVESRAETQEVRVFVDGVRVLTAPRTSVGSGHIGFGSFDDVGRMRKLRIWTKDGAQTAGDAAFFPTLR